MSRIAIVGPGAIGCVLAAILHRTQRHDLLLCARRPLSEVAVESGDGTVRFTPRVATTLAAATPADWIFVTTKAYDSASAAAWLAPLGAEGARLAVIQNGVEHRERFAGLFPADRVVPVMVDLPAERRPDRVLQRGPARLVVGDDPAGHDFVQLFAGSTASVSVAADMKSVVWRKLCTNAAGVVSALVDQPNRALRAPEGAALARAIVRECMAVARAEGATLPDDTDEVVVQGYQSASPEGINSLYADRLAGRPTEIDARNGVIVRLGRRHGIPTPYNEMAVALVALTSPPRAS